MRHVLSSLVLVALTSSALAARADPPAPVTPPPAPVTPPPAHELWPAVHTGMSAPDVGPIFFGVVAEGVHIATFAGCFLALDDNQTCAEIAGKARDKVTAEATAAPLSGARSP